jgi:tetratricopeptide (TPR) repeat protein
LPTEAQVLSEAYRRLRAEDDPAGALGALDEHARRFPFGALQPEAALARAEALLRLGRRQEGLAAIEALPAERGRERERAVVRGELRAGLGRWPQALVDFDYVLAAAIADESDERALRGRAACRAHLGDTAGARADLQRYLQRHADAPRAGEVRRALEAAP